MVELLTVVIRRLREDISQAEWQGRETDALRLQLRLALQDEADGKIWHVSF